MYIYILYNYAYIYIYIYYVCSYIVIFMKSSFGGKINSCAATPSWPCFYPYQTRLSPGRNKAFSRSKQDEEARGYIVAGGRVGPVIQCFIRIKRAMTGGIITSCSNEIF